MADETTTSAPVTLTKRAIAQVKKAAAREKQPKSSGLRILLVQVGNGYRYDMQFETKAGERDLVSNQGGVNVYVDVTFAPVLEGTELDFYESKVGNGFIFHRANQDEDA
jgi:iron-sulfur cluster assembly accessory protein